jgi:ATP-dependent RNA helicase RhlE
MTDTTLGTPATDPEGAFATLIPEIQKAIAAKGYVTPTPIQDQCIPHLLEGRDILGTAQTGTGKTAAFTLPLLQRFAANKKWPWKGTPLALVLAPTRELAAQIGESIEAYGKFLKVSHTVIFGGVNQSKQVKALNKGVSILVATPGRLLDLMQQGSIRLNKIEIFVLDEVDRMLDMGFIPDIRRILSLIPRQRQTLFFSATMSPKMLELANTMVQDPVQISIEPDKPAVERIEQKVYFVDKNRKNSLLTLLLDDPKINKVLIFTQMKHTANKVMEKLYAAGIQGSAIHGNKTQAARVKALDGFKRNRYKVLVATDVAARGLDVDDITHVINYDLPREAETYVHRIGRTARAGAEGIALSFCSAEERVYLKEIERLLGKPVPADMEHQYHSDEAFRSKMPAEKNFGRRGGGGRRGNRPPRRTSGQGRSRNRGKK